MCFAEKETGIFRGRFFSYPDSLLEAKPRSELELARGIDRVCDLSEGKALLRRIRNTGHAWVSVLRRVSGVIRGDIKAECFRFPEHKRLVNGKVKIASTSRANVIKIGRRGSGNERAGGNGEAVVVEPCGCGMGSAG